MIKTYLLKEVVATAAVITATLSGKAEPREIYPTCAHVVWVQDGGAYADDAVVIQVNGHYYGALADDLEVDDFAAVIMDTNGTEGISDDTPISIQYIGRP